MVVAHYLVAFRVSPDSLTWLVKHGAEVMSRHRRKRDAVREASALAKRDAPSVLVIERMDGTREGERTYGSRERERKPRRTVGQR